MFLLIQKKKIRIDKVKFLLLEEPSRNKWLFWSSIHKYK